MFLINLIFIILSMFVCVIFLSKLWKKSRLSEVKPSAPEVPAEVQIRVSPTLRRTLSDKENENEPSPLAFTIQNFDKIRNTLNDGEIPPS